jgi:hypothetical protein
MAADDEKVLTLPSVEELIANPTRYREPEQRADGAASGHAARVAEGRGQARPQPVPPPPLQPGEPGDGVPAGGGPEDFDAESGEYKAFGWAGNKSQTTLIIILKDGTELGFNYADLATSYPNGSMFLRKAPGRKGNVIRLLVHGDEGLFAVILEGIGLRQVWGLVMQHRTPWIHELPEGATPVPGEPVIRSFTFLKVKRQRAGGGKGAVDSRAGPDQSDMANDEEAG